MTNARPDLRLPRLTRAETVADSIEARISAEALPSGHRLGTKESLRSEFDVAVATFNEAVRLLSARGTIRVRPGVQGGIFVAAPTAAVRLGRKLLTLSGESVSVADCLVVRESLDPLIVREATMHRTAEDLRHLRKLVRAMSAKDLSMTDYLHINWAMHRRIAEITPNQLLRHTYVSLLEFIESRVQGVTPDDPGAGIADGIRIHQELVEAIASEDLERAARVAADHARLTTRHGEAK